MPNASMSHSDLCVRACVCIPASIVGRGAYRCSLVSALWGLRCVNSMVTFLVQKADGDRVVKIQEIRLRAKRETSRSTFAWPRSCRLSWCAICHAPLPILRDAGNETRNRHAMGPSAPPAPPLSKCSQTARDVRDHPGNWQPNTVSRRHDNNSERKVLQGPAHMSNVRCP